MSKRMNDLELTVSEGILHVVDLDEYIGFRLMLDGDPDCENVQHIVIPKFKFEWIMHMYNDWHHWHHDDDMGDMKAKGEVK